MENQKLELAKQYFEAYPNEEVVFISSDNQVFLQKNQHDGYNHQRSIDPVATLLKVLRKQVFPLAAGLDLDENEEEGDDLDLDDDDDRDLDLDDENDDADSDLDADKDIDRGNDDTNSDLGAEVKELEKDSDDRPDLSWTNAEIIDWLKHNGVEAKGTKAELLAEVDAVILGGRPATENENK